MKKFNELPLIEYLNECFEVNFETGILIWKHRPVSHFINEHVYKIWTTRYCTKKAGSLQSDGYCRIFINKHQYLTHRIIWLLYYKNIDNSLDIDHINGIRSDNRISNLRLVDRSINMRNSKFFKTNTSGFKGVYWNKRNKRWQASIDVNYKPKYLGLFINKEDAIEARKKAEIKYGYLNTH